MRILKSSTKKIDESLDKADTKTKKTWKTHRESTKKLIRKIERDQTSIVKESKTPPPEQVNQIASFLFILTGMIIILGFTGSYLFKKKGIPENLLLIFFGILLGPVFHLVDPSGFQNIAHVFSSQALIVILFDGGMNFNLYKVPIVEPREA